MLITKMVEVQWNKNEKYRRYYIEKGYRYNGKHRESFMVRIEDLPYSSKKEVEFICDYCGKKEKREYYSYNKGKMAINKDACKNCYKLKKRDISLISLNSNIAKQKLTIAAKERATKKRHTYDYVKLCFIKKGYKLLAKTYTDNKQILNFICLKHKELGVLQTRFINFSKKHQCKECQREEREKLNKKIISKLNKIEYYNDILNGKKKKFPEGFFKYMTEKEFCDLLKHFFDVLIINNEISSLDNIAIELKREHFIDYKLNGFVNNNSIYDLVNMIYPNKYKRWEFKNSSVGNDYWNKNTIKEAGLWLIEKMLADNLINNIEEIPKKVSIQTFRKYGLDGLLQGKFNSCLYDFFNFIYPNRWNEWDYTFTKRGFWTKKDNRIKALKYLIENELKINIEEIPYNISYGFLVNNHHKLSLICDSYYKSDIYKWIDECYPKKFKKDDFYKHLAEDGTKLDSREEKIIHNWLSLHFKKVKKPSRTEKIFNEQYNEFYVPDWIIDDTIIVEYFGLYNDNYKGKNKIIKNYKDKANRKIDFFNSMSRYNFIALFPYDLKDGLIGVKNKFKNIKLK